MTPRTLDALLWFTLAVLLLFTIPVGYVSNDGLGHSRSFEQGTWHLNPNHLTFEPLGAWWQDLWARNGSQRESVDVLKLLSVLFGALAVGLFRYGVAARLAATRWAANHATAWVAFSSAFLRLWVSDEIHMIQMPFVVLVAWAALRYLEKPSHGRALTAGVTVGLASLTFISNLALGMTLAVALAAWHLGRREARLAIGSAISLGLGAALVAGPIFLGAWLTVPGAPGFLGWLTRYGGGQGRVSEAYGLVPSWEGLMESVIRAGYGAASALVDLTPIAAAVRDRQPPTPAAVLGSLAFLAAGAALLHGLRKADRKVLLLTAAWLAAILGFGVFWNNSDDQFYFQLAPVFGVLAARITGRRFLALSLAGLLWNVVDVTSQRILYPRWERMALLEREVSGACLVVYPGFDEPELLLRMSRSAGPIEQMAMTRLAVEHPYEEGMRALIEEIQGCSARGGRIVLIDMFDTPPDRNPWKFLWRLGYDRAAIERSLERLSVEKSSRRVGPFTVRHSKGR
ncbi:MAG TPA: glycosyltransferase family 39 protein [Thermoanaerobaculia bacterium]